MMTDKLSREELRRHRAVLRMMYGVEVQIVTLTGEIIFTQFFGSDREHIHRFRWADFAAEPRHCKCMMASGGETWEFPVLSHYRPAKYVFEIDLP